MSKVLAIITHHVTGNIVRAGIELGTLTEVITDLDTTADLSSGLPDNLGKVTSVGSETRVVVVVVLDFTVPAINNTVPVRVA